MSDYLKVMSGCSLVPEFWMLMEKHRRLLSLMECYGRYLRISLLLQYWWLAHLFHCWSRWTIPSIISYKITCFLLELTFVCTWGKPGRWSWRKWVQRREPWGQWKEGLLLLILLKISLPFLILSLKINKVILPFIPPHPLGRVQKEVNNLIFHQGLTLPTHSS